jgi:hypothetical protein
MSNGGFASVRATYGSDIWMLGQSLCFVATGGKYAFGNGLADHQGNRDRRPPNLATLNNSPLSYLISWMLEYDPLRRPQIEVVTGHPAFMAKEVIAKKFSDLSQAIQHEDSADTPFNRNMGQINTYAAQTKEEWQNVGVYQKLVRSNKIQKWELEGQYGKILIAFLRNADEHAYDAFFKNQPFFKDVDFTLIAKEFNFECCDHRDYLIYHPKLSWFSPLYYRYEHEVVVDEIGLIISPSVTTPTNLLLDANLERQPSIAI